MWVSTIERMPIENQPVLAVDSTGDMAIAEVIDGVFRAVAFGFNAYENNGSWDGGPDRITGIVTHWMTLPAPPGSA